MDGVISERSGVINIGIEGTMLLSGFGGFFFAYLTQNSYVGVLAAFITGLLVGGLHSLMTITWKMDQIIAGTIINILASGLTSFLYVAGVTIPNNWPMHTSG